MQLSFKRSMEIHFRYNSRYLPCKISFNMIMIVFDSLMVLTSHIFLCNNAKVGRFSSDKVTKWRSCWYKLILYFFRALEYCLDVEKLNLTAIRTVRVLRPLRAINRIPSKETQTLQYSSLHNGRKTSLFWYLRTLKNFGNRGILSRWQNWSWLVIIVQKLFLRKKIALFKGPYNSM